MSEKTEPPSSKKLRDARKKGEVANSREVVSTALMLALIGLVYSQGAAWAALARDLTLMPERLYRQPFGDAVRTLTHACLEVSMRVLIPVVVIVVVGSIAATCAQVGLLVVAESVKPTLGKLNPMAGLKRIFALQNLFEFVKALVKIGILSFLIYRVIRDGLPEALQGPACGLDCVLDVFGAQTSQIVKYTAGAFAVVAAVDFLFQKWNHLRKLKMSKDELKREFKEMEGDPQIKGRRKQLHQQLINEGMVEKTRKATVLVTNPTHVAVALFYDKDTTPLPLVVAKGENLLARRMIEVAKAEGIPIMRDVSLARALNAGAPLDTYVPSDLIEPVAEVLRWVQQLSHAT